MDEIELSSRLNQLKTIDEKIKFLEKFVIETKDEKLKKAAEGVLKRLNNMKVEKPKQEPKAPPKTIESILAETSGSAPVIPNEPLKLEEYKAPPKLEQVADAGVEPRSTQEKVEAPSYITSDSESYMRTEAELRAEMDSSGMSEGESATRDYERQMEEKSRQRAVQGTQRMMSRSIHSDSGPVRLDHSDFGQGEYIPQEDRMHKEASSTASEFSRGIHEFDLERERDLITGKLKYKRKDV